MGLKCNWAMLRPRAVANGKDASGVLVWKIECRAACGQVKPDKPVGGAGVCHGLGFSRKY